MTMTPTEAVSVVAARVGWTVGLCFDGLWEGCTTSGSTSALVPETGGMLLVGVCVVGEPVGPLVGRAVVGPKVGSFVVGRSVGRAVVGRAVGVAVGAAVVGRVVGARVGGSVVGGKEQPLRSMPILISSVSTTSPLATVKDWAEQT